MDRNDRSAINRALAKAIAYRDCGDQEKAEHWARELVVLLECARILAADPSTPGRACSNTLLWGER